MVNISTIIDNSAQRLGATDAIKQFIRNCAHAESGTNGSTTLKSRSGGSATGLWQQTDDNWNHYGRGDRYDASNQCDAAIRFAMDNRAAIMSITHQEPTVGELYLAHFAGTGGAKKVLRAGSNTPIGDLMSAEALSRNSRITYNGKSFRQFTAGDLRNWAEHKMGGQLNSRDLYADWSVNDSGVTGDDTSAELQRRQMFARDVMKISPDQLKGVDLSNDNTFFALIAIKIIGALFPKAGEMLAAATTGPDAAPTVPVALTSANGPQNPSPGTPVRSTRLMSA